MRISKVLVLLVAAMLLVSLESALAAKVNLEFWKPSWPPHLDNWYAAQVEEYNKEHPDIEVKLTAVPGEYVEKLLVSYAGGVGPDVLHMAPPYLPPFLNAGLIEDLKPHIPAEYFDDLYEAVRLGWFFEGELYALSAETAPIALFYRTDFFEEAGIAEPPQDWDELLDTTQKLTIPDKRWGFTSSAHIQDAHALMYINSFIWQSGGDYVDKYYKPTKAICNTPEVARALQFLGDFYTKYKVATAAEIRDPLITGTTAISMTGPWQLGYINANAPDLPFDVVPLPKGPVQTATTIGGWATSVATTTKHMKEAIDFTVWLAADTKRIHGWNEVLGTIPPLKSSAAMLDFEGKDAKKKSFVYMLENFDKPRIEPPFDPEINKAIYESMQEVIFKGATGEEAAAIMEKKINEHIEETM